MSLMVVASINSEVLSVSTIINGLICGLLHSVRMSPKCLGISNSLSFSSTDKASSIFLARSEGLQYRVP